MTPARIYLSSSHFLSTLFVISTSISVLGTSAFAEEPKHSDNDRNARETRSASDLIPYTALRDAVTGEMGDLARALRSIDQSFTYRGIQGCGSCTAGSVFVDFHAKGIEPPKNVRILPPPPLNLSGHNYIDHCKTCGEHFEECRGCNPREVAAHAHCHSCKDKELVAPQLVAPQQSGTYAADQFHLAFTICLAKEACSKFTPILTMGDHWNNANFSLGQISGDLRFRFLTDQQDQFGSFQHEVNLGHIGTGQHEIQLDYQPGELMIKVDGSHFGTLNVEGHLSSWKPADPTLYTESWDGEFSILELTTP